MECLVNGFPKPKSIWIHDGKQIDENLKKYRRIGVDKSSLLIENIEVEDSGVYSCRAENGDDSTDASAHVVVQSAPKIVKAPQSLRIQETMDVEVGFLE